MKPELKKRALVVFLLCVGLFAAGAILSTEEFMNKLPVHERFRCALCHSTSQPDISNKGLNPFGTDFLNNGTKWDQTLANLDSDGDGYKNGLEIGDEDGDGTPSVTRERSNPGDPLGTPSSLDEHTWGVIKKLFEE